MEKEEWLGKLKSGKTHVAVIGMGYVGLPLCGAIADSGLAVTGFDIDSGKINLLNAGKSYISHIPDTRIAAMRATGRFAATDDFTALERADAILICVPTPLGRHKEPVMDYIRKAGAEISPHLRKGQLVVLESTTYPGTTTELLKPLLEKSGLKSGDDFFLGFSPEREDPGNKAFTTASIPKIVSGDGPVARELVAALYSRFVKQVVPVSKPEVAETAKLLENIFREVNIGLVNELKIALDALDIDIWEVIEAAKTKPFGFMPFYPCPGVGGHCIPTVPFYLDWKAKEAHVTTRFIELAGEIDDRMPDYVLGKLRVGLDHHFHRGLDGAKILLLGVAYKKNIDDPGESPAIRIAELLAAAGALISYHDPYIPRMPDHERFSKLAGMESSPADRAAIAEYDAALIITDHDNLDWQGISDNARLIVDTRNAMVRCKPGKCIVIKA